MCLPVKTTWLAVLFFFVGCASSRQRSGSPIDPALLMLAPSDTSSLVWVKMEKLVKTPGFDYLAKSGMIQDALDPIASQTSFDPRKDFWEMLLVSNGRDILMLARGQFAAMGMEPEFKKQGSERSAYRGQTFISTGGTVLTFMSPSSIAVGGRETLERLVNERAERRAGPSPALMARAEQIDRKAQVWWAVSSPVSLLPKQVPAASGGFGNILANLPRLLNGVRMITGSMDLSGGIRAVSTAEFGDGSQARQSAEAMGAFLALARATVPKARQRQLSFYDSVKVELSDSVIRVSIDVPMSTLTEDRHNQVQKPPAAFIERRDNAARLRGVRRRITLEPQSRLFSPMSYPQLTTRRKASLPDSSSAIRSAHRKYPAATDSLSSMHLP